MRGAYLVTTPCQAVMVTRVEAEVTAVVMAKEACVAPAGTVTMAGTEARAGSVLVTSMSSPGAGAGLVSVTVAVALLLPTSETGAMLRSASVTGGGSTVTIDERLMPLRVADTTTGVAVDTALVDSGALPSVLPAGTVRLAAGTIAS